MTTEPITDEALAAIKADFRAQAKSQREAAERAQKSTVPYTITPAAEQARCVITADWMDDAADTIESLIARIESAEAENAHWQRNSRESFEALAAMRNDLNEIVPIPSLESDLLTGPETSVFCAVVVGAVAETIDRLEARVKALEEALQPFAARAALYDPAENDDEEPDWSEKGPGVSVGDLRRARAALGGVNG